MNPGFEPTTGRSLTRAVTRVGACRARVWRAEDALDSARRHASRTLADRLSIPVAVSSVAVFALFSGVFLYSRVRVSGTVLLLDPLVAVIVVAALACAVGAVWIAAALSSHNGGAALACIRALEVFERARDRYSDAQAEESAILRSAAFGHSVAGYRIAPLVAGRRSSWQGATSADSGPQSVAEDRAPRTPATGDRWGLPGSNR